MAEPFRGAVADADLRLLRVFRAVADQGGFAGAEVALNKSRSAISMDITALEHRLGLRLCARGRGGFSMTEAGQAVLDAATALFDEIERFRDRVASASGRLTGRVALLLVDNIVSVASEPLSRAIGDFARRHPDVRLDVGSAPPGAVERAVLDGEADLGISVVPRPMEQLTLHPLFAEEVRLYCGRANTLFALDEAALTAELVRAQKLVRPSAADQPSFLAALEAFAPGPRADTLDARVLLILSGAFVGFLPPHYAAAWIARGELREILPAVFRGENMFHMLTRGGVRLGAAAAAFHETILAEFASGAFD